MKELKYTPMVPTDDGNGYLDPDGKTWQELNSKQKKFVREYVKGQTPPMPLLKRDTRRIATLRSDKAVCYSITTR